MHSSFSAINTNQFSRKWAGTSNAVDPYVSGYFFTKWKKGSAVGPNPKISREASFYWQINYKLA